MNLVPVSIDNAKVDVIIINKIIKDIYSDNIHIKTNKYDMLLPTIATNFNLIHDYNADFVTNLNVLIYNEIIICRSDFSNFINVEEFIFYCLFEIHDRNSVQTSKVKWDKIFSAKKILSVNEFEEILKWGFWDLIYFENGLMLEYTKFISAFSYYEYPDTPLLVAILDNSVYFFMSNPY